MESSVNQYVVVCIRLWDGGNAKPTSRHVLTSLYIPGKIVMGSAKSWRKEGTREDKEEERTNEERSFLERRRVGCSLPSTILCIQTRNKPE